MDTTSFPPGNGKEAGKEEETGKGEGVREEGEREKDSGPSKITLQRRVSLTIIIFEGFIDTTVIFSKEKRFFLV